MKLIRHGAVVGAVAISAFGLVACGSDNNSTSSGATGSAIANSTASCEGKANLSGAGSSAQKNAMDAFTKAYIAACQSKGKSVNVAYNASGSGDGRSQFVNSQVDFAGSDSAIKEDQAVKAKQRCNGNEAWNIPLVFGPVALAYNIEGVDNLVLNGEVTAKIFHGAVTKWNDPAIAALNGGVALPDKEIAVFSRSDSSGTTDNFQQYLAASSKGAWPAADTGSDFKGKGSGAKGSAGVAQAVAGTPYSITYVEKSFADQNKLTVARIDSGSGPVALSNDAVAKAITATKVKHEGSLDLALDLKSTYASSEAGVYPLILATYEVVCSKGYQPEVGSAVKSFLTSAVNEGQQGLDKLGYVPLPDAFKSKVVASINAIG